MPEFQPQLHFFVCVNDRRGTGKTKPSCGPWMDETVVKTLKKRLIEKGWGGKIYITKTGCLGACNSEGGVIAVYPSGEFYKGFTSVEEAEAFIFEQIAATGLSRG